MPTTEATYWEPECLSCGMTLGYTAKVGVYGAKLHCDGCSAKSDADRLFVSGLPYEYRTFTETVDTFVPHNKSHRAAVQSCRRFLAGGVRWLYIHSADPTQVGVGKTHLAASTAAAWVAQHKRPAAFARFERIVSEINDSFSPDRHVSEYTIVRRYATVPLLVIDDLGVEAPTEHTIRCLHSIVDDRSGERLPTIFTSNYPLGLLGERLVQRLHDDTPVLRILSRIGDHELTERVEMSGEDMRRVKRETA